jgi:superoxide dismutase
MLDYGIKRGDYIDAFFRGLHWPVVQGRFTRPRRLRRQSA